MPRHFQPPSGLDTIYSDEGEEFAGLDDVMGTTSDDDIDEAAATVEVAVVGEDPTYEDYEDALKAAQLQLGSLAKLVKEQAATIATLKAQQPKRSRKQPSGQSDLPKSIEDRREMISHLGRRFALMNNPFFPMKLEGHLVASTRPNVASSDSERYRSDAAMQACLLAEVYEVVPSDLHAAMHEYRQFEHIFTKAGKSFLRTVMSDLRSKILPVIFGSIPQIVSRLKADFNRSEIQEFDALLKPVSELARKKYTKYAPILFPDCQTDMSMLFMSRELALALKGLLQGAASISRTKTYAKPKTYAKLWKVLYVTEGSIATITILVRAAFSPDSEFDAAGKGARSGIDYEKDFNSYREFMQAKAGTPYHKALLKFYNDIIFKAQTLDNNTMAPNNDDDSSGLEEAFTRLALTPTTSTPAQASNSGAHAERHADSTINSAGSSHQPQSSTSVPSQPIVQEVARPANARKGKKKARAPATELATVTTATEMAAAAPASHQPQSTTSVPSQPIVQEVARPANARKGKKKAQVPATELVAMEMVAAVPAATRRTRRQLTLLCQQASEALEPIDVSCHLNHLVEPEEVVEVLALVRVSASLKGLSEQTLAQTRFRRECTDFDGDGAQIEVVPEEHVRGGGPERSVGLP
ncbi:uncharacterized protein LACBIDRAFT_328850 [Laccaria bicolor S238N-H82]|uniref:Predicted protein n=1 Tax=Laccaria bicolor (strain S238N-H82 / ATCC MYA-4686) TaxID=486041 RepID=B0DG68_LACBS|nr:uncharacterized protein LACBIDRAFT_328850 [Laccaria bicolor S238N-H82]EDR06460.1 predicted protein [Laccaria bicolor S238N-H82]|eukprot:XP_001882832.1 predicted protein [Laccaria bicolor S238N-H82]